MKTALLVMVVGLLAGAGCLADHPPAPEELALDRFDDGEKLFAAGQYTDAAIEFEYAVNSRPRWKAPYLRLAACHEKSRREDDAIAVLERLLHVDGTDDDALRALGRIYAGRGDPAAALGFYRKLKAQHPDDPSLDGEIVRLEAMRKP
ncbi:MAG TPA: tetratricopeptide repeat protein [Planctomycetota bacterium]|nr:tetratricopeptide repeat protein [Planctomycetota bacterium]